MADMKRWQLGECTWLQDDTKKRLVLANLRGVDRSSALPEQQDGLELVVPARRHIAGQESRACACEWFPCEFEYCPFCGSALDDVRRLSSESWLPPYGAADGTRISPLSGFGAPGTGEDHPAAPIGGVAEFSLPRQSGSFAFAVGRVGTTERVLLSIERSGGKIYVFSPNYQRWLALECTGTTIDCTRQPDWSWSVACDEGPGHGALCWPSPEGPVWCDLDMFRLSGVAARGEGRCVGGAAHLNNHFLIPGQAGGKLVLNRFDANARKWEILPAADIQFGAADYLSVPVVDVNRERIYWIGEAGYLTCATGNGQLTVSWQAWDTSGKSCRGLPQYGPPYIDKQNRFWQLCLHTDRDESYRYYELGDAHERHDDISGERFSTGRVSLARDHNYWDDPWDEPRGDRLQNIRIPLVQFCESIDQSTMVTLHIAATSQLISEIYERDGGYVDREAKDITFRVESREDLPRELKLPTVLSAKKPWECKAFIFQGRLYIYIPDKLKCYSWPLQA